MLRDETWLKLADKADDLCGDCFFARATERGVPIALADLRPCPFNLFHRPHSWFDLFADGEQPDVVAAWLDEAERGPRP